MRTAPPPFLPSTSFDYAAVERQTIKLNTSNISVNFGVAAPRPWGEGRVVTPNTIADITKAPFSTVCITPKGQKRQTGSSMVT